MAKADAVLVVVAFGVALSRGFPFKLGGTLPLDIGIVLRASGVSRTIISA